MACVAADKVLASVLIGNLAVECDRVRDDMASGDGLALLHALVAQRGVTEGNEEREVESDGKDDEAAAEAVLAACLNLAQGHVACAQKWRECSGVRTLLADLRAAGARAASPLSRRLELTALLLASCAYPPRWPCWLL